MISRQQRAQIVEYVRTHRIHDDKEFHAFAKRIGVDPDDAEPIVYQMAYDLAQRCAGLGSPGLSTGWKVGLGICAAVTLLGVVIWRVVPPGRYWTHD